MNIVNVEEQIKIDAAIVWRRVSDNYTTYEGTLFGTHIASITNYGTLARDRAWEWDIHTQTHGAASGWATTLAVAKQSVVRSLATRP